MTGFTVAHGSVAELTSPASMPAHLLALDEPDTPAAPGDGALRSAIVGVARHYLQLARTRTPAEMESLIWRASSADGADHGQSCAAFASLTLALGAERSRELVRVHGKVRQRVAADGVQGAAAVPGEHLDVPVEQHPVSRLRPVAVAQRVPAVIGLGILHHGGDLR